MILFLLQYFDAVSRCNRYYPKRKKNLTQSRKEFAIYNECNSFCMVLYMIHMSNV